MQVSRFWILLLRWERQYGATSPTGWRWDASGLRLGSGGWQWQWQALALAAALMLASEKG
jgi:hypothetical protein